MLYDTDSRLHAAREHADRLALDMQRSRRLSADAGYPGWSRLGAALAGRIDRLRRRRGSQVPAYEA
jgi:hypothetical protein